jgi:uncharacterized protein
MVDITPRPAAERQVVQAYGSGGFRISGRRYAGGVLVLPELTLAWPVPALAAVTPNDLAALHRHRPAIELLILGTGRSLLRPSKDLAAALRGWGIAMEPMDTGAACRTYNVLLLEDRRAAAALIAVD